MDRACKQTAAKLSGRKWLEYPTQAAGPLYSLAHRDESELAALKSEARNPKETRIPKAEA
jgi:hypothetical protein